MRRKRFWSFVFCFGLALAGIAFAGEKAEEEPEKPEPVAPCVIYVLPYSGEPVSESAIVVGAFLRRQGFKVLDPVALEKSLEEDEYSLTDLLDVSEGACKIAFKAGAKYVIAVEDNRHADGRKLLAIRIDVEKCESSPTAGAIAVKGKGYDRAVHEVCYRLGFVKDAAPEPEFPEQPPDMRDVSRLKKKRMEESDFEPAGSGKDLVKNGGFEELDKKGNPVGWETLDGLTQFVVDRAEGGKCLMFDTDVDQGFVEKWRTILKRNPDATPPKDPNIKRHPPDKPGYNTIGGIEGVLVLTDSIPVEKGACYRFTVDVMSDETKAMLFIKGYAHHEESGRDRQYYLGQKHGDEHAKKENAAKWFTYSYVFFPTWRTPQVEYIRIELYGYWKPGKVYFDNIRFEKVKPLDPELSPEKRKDEVSKSYREEKDGKKEDEPAPDETGKEPPGKEKEK
ncbi:MAG: hypothetical protein ACYS8W_06705 [Planctomycetota bacterium]|jgi:hypothetical protein